MEGQRMTKSNLFWENVRKIMAVKGMLPKDLAERLGITRGYLSMLMNNNRETRYTIMEETANILHTPLDRLLSKDILQDLRQFGESEGLSEIVRLYRQLQQERRDELINIARILCQANEPSKSGQPNEKEKPKE